MVAAERRTLGLTIRTEARGPFHRKWRDVGTKKVVLAEGDFLEVDSTESMRPDLDGSTSPEFRIVRSIVLSSGGPILRTEFQGTGEDPVDVPLKEGEIEVVKGGLFHRTTIRG